MIDLMRFRLRRYLCLLTLFFAIAGCNLQNSSRLHPPASAWMLADLDGDHEPDVAQGLALGRTKDGYFYEVQIQLSSNASARTLFLLHNSALGLRIPAHYLDGDDDIGLILTYRFF